MAGLGMGHVEAGIVLEEIGRNLIALALSFQHRRGGGRDAEGRRQG
jgi:hypothetical protein